MTESLEKLVKSLQMLPSVGEKSAWRMALYLMEQDENVALTLSKSLVDAKTKLQKCKRCFTWSEDELCPICNSKSRDTSTICLVEKPSDMWSIEKSGHFRGVYHILGGLLSPIDGITVDSITIQQLIDRVNEGDIEEIIIGLGSSSEAETTTHYISKLLSQTDIKITRFARGLSAGMEIEYADRFTIDQALSERRTIIYD